MGWEWGNFNTEINALGRIYAAEMQGLLASQWRGPQYGHPPKSQSFMEAWWPRWHQEMTQNITGHGVLSLPLPVILTCLLLCFMCSKVWRPPPLVALNETLGHDFPDECTSLALLLGWGHPREKMASSLFSVRREEANRAREQLSVLPTEPCRHLEARPSCPSSSAPAAEHRCTLPCPPPLPRLLLASPSP